MVNNARPFGLIQIIQSIQSIFYISLYSSFDLRVRVSRSNLSQNAVTSHKRRVVQVSTVASTHEPGVTLDHWSRFKQLHDLLCLRSGIVRVAARTSNFSNPYWLS